MKINTVPQDSYSFETPRGVEGYGTEIVPVRSVYKEAILHHLYKYRVSNIETSFSDNTKIHWRI
jgi:hypothetical protein